MAGLETQELFAGTGKDREKIRLTHKVKLPDRLKALELLGKHLRLFADVQVQEGSISLRERIARGRRRAMKKV